MSAKYARYRMQVYNKSSLADAACSFMNIGESIQYLALDGIYRTIGVNPADIIDVTADDVAHYTGDRLYLPGKFILNDRPVNRVLPFPEDVVPVLISSVMLRNEEIPQELVEYLKRVEPIGCRDEQARTMLRELGIEAYLMGCFTMCLPRRASGPKPGEGKTFLVDISDNLYPYIPPELKKNAVRISHAVPVYTTRMTVEEDDRLNREAETLLRRYRDEADLVITSRLHAAAPCIAMGIPVVLASDDIDFRYAWLDKYVPIYTLDDYGRIDWSPRVPSSEEVKRWIPAYIKKRLSGDPAAVEELKKLDAFYMDRDRVDYYGYFRTRIGRAGEMAGRRDFRYIIWGAGLHSGYAYDIIRELYPEAELVSVIDKYERGVRFGKEIIPGEKLTEKNFDVAFITTKPGTPDAVEKMAQLFGPEAERRCIIVTSQQKS